MFFIFYMHIICLLVYLLLKILIRMSLYRFFILNDILIINSLMLISYFNLIDYLFDLFYFLNAIIY